MLSGLKTRFWRSHLIVWLLLTALIVLAAIALPTFFAFRSATTELVIEGAQQLTHLSAVRMRDELSKFSESLVALARTGEISTRNPAIQSQALRQAVAVREGRFDGGVILLDNFGRVTASEPSRPEIIGQDWSDRDYFRRLLDSRTAVFSNSIGDGPDGSPVVVVSIPVLNTDGRFVGALVGMFRLGESSISPLYASIVRLRIGRNGSTYVVDGNGKILFDSASNRVGQVYSTLALPELANRDQAGAVRIQDAANRDIVASYAPIPGTPWLLVTEEDWASLVGATKQYLDLLLALLALGAILPVVGVGLLAAKRNTGIVEREYQAQEMQLAREIKCRLLPEQVPVLPGWAFSVHNQPAPTVGGAFHDFMLLPDGRLMLVMAEVPEQGVPAILTMASTRTALRGATLFLLSPSQVLLRSNQFLCPELPEDTVVASVYGILDPSNGTLCFGNAGHPAPLHLKAGNVRELAGAGVPLSQQLDASYEEQEVRIDAGECILLYSKGLLETKNSHGDSIDLAWLKSLMSGHPGGSTDLIEAIVTTVQDFTGGNWEPKQDVTLVLLEHLATDTSR